MFRILSRPRFSYVRVRLTGLTEKIEFDATVLPFTDYSRIYTFSVNHQFVRGTHIRVRRKQLIEPKALIRVSFYLYYGESVYVHMSRI